MRLHKIERDHLAGLGLSSETCKFLNTTGLPVELNELKDSIEINFYSDKAQIVKKVFRGVNYVVVGDDSVAAISISLADDHVYAVDFSNSLPVDPICFVNSRIDKFVHSIEYFLEFKGEAEKGEESETVLIQRLKAKIRTLDEKALDHGAWWAEIINDPIGG